MPIIPEVMTVADREVIDIQVGHSSEFLKAVWFLSTVSIITANGTTNILEKSL